MSAELAKIMKEVEDSKPTGWGFKKSNGANDEYTKSVALKKLELAQKK